MRLVISRLRRCVCSIPIRSVLLASPTTHLVDRRRCLPAVNADVRNVRFGDRAHR